MHCLSSTFSGLSQVLKEKNWVLKTFLNSDLLKPARENTSRTGLLYKHYTCLCSPHQWLSLTLTGRLWTSSPLSFWEGIHCTLPASLMYSKPHVFHLLHSCTYWTVTLQSPLVFQVAWKLHRRLNKSSEVFDMGSRGRKNISYFLEVNMSGGPISKMTPLHRLIINFTSAEKRFEVFREWN